MGRLVLGVVCSLIAVPASAQSAYVAGTVGADVSRQGRTESNFSQAFSIDSEAFSWSLRTGTAVGQNWGVELEFVRSGRSHRSAPVGPPILATGVPAITTIPVSNIPTAIAFQTDMRSSHTDFDPVVWARQGVSGSVDLVYLGGVAFTRDRVEISQTFPTILRVFAPVPGGSFRTTVINYGVHPLVGAEARIRMTSHMRLVPGIRVQGVDGGWLMRPYAGLGWFF
jgi:hypothetical protein